MPGPCRYARHDVDLVAARAQIRRSTRGRSGPRSCTCQVSGIDREPRRADRVPAGRRRRRACASATGDASAPGRARPRCRTRATACRRAARARGSACATASCRHRSRSDATSSRRNAEPRFCRLIPQSSDAQARTRARRSSTGSGSRACRRGRRCTGRWCRRRARDRVAAPTRARGRWRRAGAAIQSSASIAVAGERHRGRDRRGSALRSASAHFIASISRCCAVGAVGAEIEAVDDAQRLERGDALGRRRHLERSRCRANGSAQRIDPRARVAGEVVGGHEPAVRLQLAPRSRRRSGRGSTRRARRRRACGSCARARVGASSRPARCAGYVAPKSGRPKWSYAAAAAR